MNLQYMQDITGVAIDPPRHARAFGERPDFWQWRSSWLR